ncbi:MAG: hypothetical protein JXQ30_07675 [Spirochaetes bacterium]|nr:hypothetical protein [Spirochaetota bacterium]
MKTNRKAILSAAVSALCALSLIAGSSGEPPWRTEVLEAELRDIDLSRVDDGLYTGRHEYRSKMYIVQAEVSDPRIVKIEIVEWEENDARAKALAVFDLVIERQSLCVDAVTGATTASKLYLLCLENAFSAYKCAECPGWELK